MARPSSTLFVLLVVLSVITTALVGSVGATEFATGAAPAIDADCEYPLERTDARGETVELAEEPEAVVTLYPGDAQLAYQIGAEDRVGGMPIGPYTDALDPGDRTDVSGSDGVTPVVEEVIALDPDVVIAANVAMTQPDLIDQLESAGIPVFVHERATSIDGVRENVEATGELTGECDGAETTVDWLDDRLAAVEDGLADADEPLAYYAMGEGGETAGTGTFQHEVLTTAGLENVAERAGLEDWGEVSAEVVVAEDPEWIVYPDWTDEAPIGEALEGTTAVQEGNVVAVDDNAMSQPAPGIAFVVEHLVRDVHPDVYDEIEDDLESIDDEYGVEDGLVRGGAAADGDDAGSDGSDDGTATDEGNDAGEEDDGEAAAVGEAADGDDSIPGFGPVVVALGIGTAVALQRIR